MTERTIGGVIFCYYREARGAASRALKAAKIDAEYLSSAAVDGDTPRYVFHGANSMQVAKLRDLLAADGAGTEMYEGRD